MDMSHAEHPMRQAKRVRDAQRSSGSQAQQHLHDLQADVLRPLVDAIPALMDDQALQELAQRLRPLLTSIGQKIEPNHNGPLLTCAEAASYARVHVETIRRAVRNNAIPVAARIGRSPRISQVGLDQWLLETSRSTAGPVERRQVRRRVPLPESRGSLKDAWS
jgi:excisionase family DNA binding protein